MLAHDTKTVGIVADLTVRVPRSAPGDVFEGTRRVVEAVDGVLGVEAVWVTSITPNLNDLFVEARVAATLALEGPVGDEREAARSVLLDGFGVDAASVVGVDRS